MISVKWKRLIKEGYRDCRDFGLELGLARMNCILRDESISSLQHKNRVILKQLKQDYSELLSQYTSAKESVAFREDAPIWVMWWDGPMPQIIDMCYRSKLRCAGTHPVNLVTKDNIGDYIQLPDAVWQQFGAGKLRVQHLADMIRVQLIRRYGGIWLDASIFCAREIPEELFHMPLFSIHGEPDLRFVSNNRWTTFAIGGYKDNVLCSFLDDFFQSFCSAGKRFLDYFMFDCAIALAYENLPAVKASVDAVSKITEDCYWLTDHLNTPAQPLDLQMLPTFSKIAWSRYRNYTPEQDSLYEMLLIEEGLWTKK